MTELTIGLFILILVALATIILLLLRKPEGKSESLLLLQQEINNLNQTLDDRLEKSSRQSAQIIEEVTERLTRLDETNKQVVNHTEKILELENIFKNPKQKGILGEFMLESLLKNILPAGQFLTQYKLGLDEATGKELIVDAVILVDKNKMIPVDAKFSLENYNRLVAEKDPRRQEELEKLFVQDLKNRIDETAKYVQPSKGTLDYALMFIPADRIYSDLLDNEVGGSLKSNTRSLIDYGHEKRVHIVSPTTFNVFLMTILQGLRAFKISEFAQEIRQRVETLGKHLGSYQEYLKKLGNNLGSTVSAYNNAAAEFKKIDKDVARITAGQAKIEIKQIDKPSGLDD